MPLPATPRTRRGLLRESCSRVRSGGYLEETFTLEEGTALVMVTDGVVEGPGLTLEAGLKRAGTLAGQALHDGLNAEEIADRILEAAVAVDHLDDVAVLVIRRI
ncbi:SpoIIE family protein phosphatase [Streptomyces sp. NPDC000133]|uniref:SpoIIE family protein phosphatase n=1 Tax=Streptomyces sp. NPDC000133 TaxID=3364535 RepID=UPI0036986476